MPQALCFADCQGRSDLRALDCIPAEEAAGTGNPRIAWLVAFLLCVVGFFPRRSETAGASAARRTAAHFLWHRDGSARPARDRERPGFPRFPLAGGRSVSTGFATLAHGSWLQADQVGFPAVVEATARFDARPRLFSALLIRFAISPPRERNPFVVWPALTLALANVT